MSVNKVFILGNLGKDPELKFTDSGKAVCNFSVATSERWKGEDGEKHENTTWHNVVVWGKMAETIKEFFSKGKEIFIEGRINNRSYNDKDGNTKYVSEIVASSFSFTSSKSDQPSDGKVKGMAQSAKDDDLPF